MATEEMVKEFEAAVNPQSEATPEAAPAAAPAQSEAAKIEELEIALNGKPFRLPVNAEIPVKHNGQILKTPLEKLLNSFRQSTHLEDKIKEYREMKAKIDQERGDFEAYNQAREKFGAIQDWSEKNPQEWERLWDLFQNKDRNLLASQVGEEQSGGVPSAFLDEFGKVKKELDELRSWKDSLSAEQQEAQTQANVEAVKKEVEEFAKEWPEIDLGERNLDGVSLKGMIMQHGIKRGIGEFKLAALDYFGPRLLEIAQNRGRTEATKQFQTDKQQGIVARSSTPFSGQSGTPDTSKMTKQELTAAARAEYERLISGGV